MSYRLIAAGRRGSLEVPRNRRLAACASGKLASWAVATAISFASVGCKQSHDKAHAREVASRVRSEFLHAWSNYEKYAWGHDALKPLSKTPHDWYGQSLLMTPVDALDTLILMKLDEEAAKAKELILKDLSFDRDVYVKNFEITIRLLGGLLSSYQLTNDKRLLDLAEDLGNRLLPVFNSPTGLPYVYVNLRTGQVRDAKTNPAETGTLLLEFGTLSKLTGKPIYYEKAKRALMETFKRRSAIGLVGSTIDVETGAWVDVDSHISGGIDSYYEYLWKCWLLFGDKDCQETWQASISAVNTVPQYGALDAFFPALLAHSGDVARARRLQDSSFKMWNMHEIEPEIIDYKTMQIVDNGYHLRPEIVESTYYLHHFTHDPHYRKMGEKIFDDFVKYCRVDSGYAALQDVVTKEKRDEMESFVLAETFKYFYLLFASPDTLDFDKVVFNTEAHPLRRTD